MKTSFRFTALLFLWFGVAPLEAQQAENRYDVLAKTLTPFLNLFAKDAKDTARAMTADFTLENLPGLPPGMGGASFHIAIESPDKVLVSGPILGENVTLCRDRQDIWAFPGAQIQSLISRIPDLAKPRAAYKLGRLELPIPEKEMVFLPALFMVREEAPQAVNGIDCRVLDLALMPELSKALKTETWQARAWVGPDYKLVRLELFGPDWHAIADVQRMEYPPALPPETWRPATEQAADVLHLSPVQFKQIIDTAAKGLGGRKKEKGAKESKEP